MSTEKKTSKAKQVFKKIGAKNLIVICAVLLIGAAICVNYILYQGDKGEPVKDVDIDLGNTNLQDTLKSEKKK